MGDGCSHVITLVNMYEDIHNDSIAWVAPEHAGHFTLPCFLWNVVRVNESAGMARLSWMEALT